MKMSTKSSSRLAMPLPAMSNPAKMYSGDARSTVLSSDEAPDHERRHVDVDEERHEEEGAAEAIGRGTLRRSSTTSRMTSRKTTMIYSPPFRARRT